MAKNSILKSLLKKPKMELHKIAHYTFFLGLILAVVTGILNVFVHGRYGLTLIRNNDLVTTLFLLGFIVGLFNLTAKETGPFLVAAIALMLAGIVNLSLVDLYGLWENLGLYLRSILSNIVVFVVPGAIILGMKTIWKMASD